MVSRLMRSPIPAFPVVSVSAHADHLIENHERAMSQLATATDEQNVLFRYSILGNHRCNLYGYIEMLEAQLAISRTVHKRF